MTKFPQTKCQWLILWAIGLIGGTISVIIPLIFYLSYLGDDKVNVSVMNATLTEFNYTKNTLYYNLILNISISHTVYYDYIDASMMYQNISFDSQTVVMFNKSFSELHMNLRGQHVMAFITNQISKLNKQKMYGVYHIHLKLCPMFRFETNKLMPIIHCDLQVSLKSNKETTPIDGFHATKCDLRYDLSD
uniref:Late embryogenesis abundant protein LEA-2 subgroup domain-containing protein n=1 Tax=Cajanus cajan TaxID=3821 RepID=A0A151RT65_CAJCA|nr:hypothetical protein KK1_032720 [Cajanus cajan]